MARVVYHEFFYRPGIKVFLTNGGDRPLRSVVLLVTGSQTTLENVAPGGSAQAMVKCTGDSHDSRRENRDERTRD